MMTRRTHRLDDDFVAVFDAHGAKLVRLAALLGAEDAEDIAQEAFCRLYQRREGLTGLADAGPYLNRTVVNLIRDRQRRGILRDRAARLERRDAERRVPSAEALGIASHEGRRLATALGSLPRRRREAVTLRYWLELSYAEIAQAMDISVGAAKSAVSRGINDLHTHLEGQ